MIQCKLYNAVYTTRAIIPSKSPLVILQFFRNACTRQQALILLASKRIRRSACRSLPRIGLSTPSKLDADGPYGGSRSPFIAVQFLYMPRLSYSTEDLG